MAIFQKLTEWGRKSSRNFNFLLALIGAGGLSLAGYGALALYAVTNASSNPDGEVFATMVMIAGATQMLGSLVGFLFGIPRTLQETREENHPISNNTRKYLVNTNLEQISDWLTKILVGVGLTQVTAIKQMLNDIW